MTYSVGQRWRCQRATGCAGIVTGGTYIVSKVSGSTHPLGVEFAEFEGVPGKLFCPGLYSSAWALETPTPAHGDTATVSQASCAACVALSGPCWRHR